MAIKIQGSTIIDDSRKVINASHVGIGTTNPTVELDVDGKANISGIVTASSFVKSSNSGGFLKADGTEDTSTYLTSYTESQTLDNVVGLGSTTTKSIGVGTVTATSFVKATNSSGFLKADGTEDTSTYLTSYTESQTLDDVVGLGSTTAKSIGVGTVTATKFVVDGGSSTGFLKADGSVDATPYATGTGSLDSIVIKDNGQNVGSASTFTSIDFYNGIGVSTTGVVGVASVRLEDNISISGIFTASSFVKLSNSGGFLKADGTEDTNTYLTSYTESQTLDNVVGLGSATTQTITVGTATTGVVIRPDGTLNASGIVTATSFVKSSNSGGFLKADGTEDTNTYLTSYTESQTLDNVVGLGSTTSQTISVGNLNVTGTGNTSTITGAANLVLDPAAVGDNTGKVIIFGNLQVDGTTTEINSTTLTIDDKSIVVASGATDSASANGAGIEVDGANATFQYAHTGTKWVANKTIEATSFVKATNSSGFLKADGTEDTSTYLTSYTETNDLSSAVTWANVPDANITESSVTQHQAALSITESQISDLQSYLTSYTETQTLNDVVGLGSDTTQTITVGTATTGVLIRPNGTLDISGTVGIGTRIDIIPYDTQNNGTLSFEGSAGQLFSITNQLSSGSIFSVNDISGIPSIDVNADGTIQLAPVGAGESVGIGTTNPKYKLHVVGTTNIDGTFTVNGAPVQTGSGVASTITVADESSDTTCFPLFSTDATGDINPKTGSNLTFNSSTGALTATSFVKATNSSGFLKADGTEDTSTYLTSYTETQTLDNVVGLGSATTQTITVGTATTGVVVRPNGTLDISGTVGIGTRIDIIPYDTQNNGTLSFEGSAGQLFSITNQLSSGSIFSVNDISGIPSIDVNADGTIQLAPVGAGESVGIGTTNPKYKLHVVGNTNIDGTFTVNGSPVSGSSSAAGSDGQIQYNNGGSFGGAAQLYYDDANNRVGINSSTPTSTLDIDGTLNVSGISTFQNNVHLLSNDHLYFGSNTDIDIYSDGTTGRLITSDTFYVRAPQLGVLNNAGSQNIAIFDDSNGVSLYHNNSKKFETTATGIALTGNIEKYDTLVGSGSTTVVEFAVTVVAKSDHRYVGGSTSAYYLDGIESPFLTLTPGRTYKFDQSDNSNNSHPLRFYLEADKTTQYTTNVTTNGTAGSAGAYTQILVTDETPIVLHYQCSAHGYMGNAVQVNSNKVNTPYLIEGLSGANISGVVTATGFATTNGTSSQFLKADGSVDSSTYLTSYTESDPVVAAINGIVKSNGTTISAATAGTDYLTPTGDGSGLSGLTGAGVGTYGSSTVSPIITVNSDGRITGITTAAISGGGGGSSVWSTSGNDAYYTTGNIGIGTASPVSDLDVRGLVTIQNLSGNNYNENLRLGRSTGGYSSIAFAANVANTSGTVAGQFTHLVYPSNTNLGDFAIRANATDALRITTGGTPQLFNAGDKKFETRTDGVSVAGIVTAISGVVTYFGDASNLTNTTDASSGTYGSSTEAAQISVDSQGRITSITNVSIVAASNATPTIRTTHNFTTTDGQTLFPPTGTIGFTSSYVDVFYNGVRLEAAEYTENVTGSSGTSITLTTPAGLNDIVDIVAYESIGISTVNLLGDTTPQLGGDLDLNGFDITGTGSMNITGIATANGGQLQTEADVIGLVLALG